MGCRLCSSRTCSRTRSAIPPAGGTVTLGAHANGAGSFELAVSDTGDGVAAEPLPRLFERFYRADRAHDGSGIGLAIVKAIVEAHGGRISAESAGRGSGSTFQITLSASVTDDKPDVNAV